MNDLLPEPYAGFMSKTEAAYLKKVRAFCLVEVAPRADAWERAEEFPRDIFRKAGRLGLMGVVTPKKWGGLGFSHAAYALVIREIARHQAALALDLAAHNALAVGHILHYGTAAQRRRLLPRLVNGDWLAAWSLTEPGAGSDSGGIETVATKRGATWELNGRKLFITQGNTADILVVMAATGVTDKGKKEISAFLVNKRGIRPVRKVPTCGMRASETSEYLLVKARGELLGTRGGGQQAALACLDQGRIGVASVAIGLGRAALDASVRHALGRRQFGRRLADFQALQFMIADCEAELYAAELLVLNACVKADRGEKHTQESAMAKLLASETGSRVCAKAMQIHGGYGYSRDLPIERYWRDAKLCEIGEGSSEVQRIVISRAVLRAAEGVPAPAR
jgi:alkylation response protein AidB-like acyl-CoA dehydrogenase